MPTSLTSKFKAGNGMDWARLAAPQDDGYDTLVVEQTARKRGSILRPAPWVRRSTTGAQKALFNGTVAVRKRPEGGLPAPRYLPADPTSLHLDAAEEILWLWPAAAAQFATLTDTIQVWTDTTLQADTNHLMNSSSHSLEDEFGVIMLTVDHPFAIAQAMIHEMAHHKLRALGVSLLRAAHLVTNDPDDLYESPIITARRRPMTAVLHAQYSFIHVTALDLKVYEATNEGSPLRRQAVELLARNVPRMQAGQRELERHLKTDENGRVFCDSFLSWSRNVVAAGHEVLKYEGAH